MRDALSDMFWDYLKPQRDEEINTAVTTAVNTAVADTTRTNLYIYVQDGAMAIDYAARQANMTADQFRAEMTNSGYTVPQTV